MLIFACRRRVLLLKLFKIRDRKGSLDGIEDAFLLVSR